MPAAARKGDEHKCPLITGAAHEGGTISTGAPTVNIEGRPAARLSDLAPCKPSIPNQVLIGEPSVRICGQPAARKGDTTVHGGLITTGASTVNIGSPNGWGAGAAQDYCMQKAAASGAIGVAAGPGGGSIAKPEATNDEKQRPESPEAPSSKEEYPQSEDGKPNMSLEPGPSLADLVGASEFLEITLQGVWDAGRAWSKSDFTRRYYSMTGKGVTVRETGHLSAIVAAYMDKHMARKNLQDQIATRARYVRTGSFSYVFENTYDMQSVVYSIGDTTIGGEFSGIVEERNGVLTISGSFEFYLDDEFADPLGIGIEVGGVPYPITDEWSGQLTGRIYLDAARSAFVWIKSNPVSTRHT